MRHPLSHTTQGFSLLQSMLCLSLVLGLSQWAVPSFYRLWQAQQTHQLVLALQRHVKWTQTQAILWQQSIAMCPIEQKSCSNNWQAEIFVFIDHNQNQLFDKSTDQILNRFYLPPSQAKLIFNQTLPVLFSSGAFSRNGSWILTQSKTEQLKITLSSTGRLHQVKINQST